MPGRTVNAERWKATSPTHEEPSYSSGRAVRSAEKHGVTVEHDTCGRLLPAFFEVRELSRVRWRRQLHEPA